MFQSSLVIEQIITKYMIFLIRQMVKHNLKNQQRQQFKNRGSTQ
jgi:hypothetical protein